MSGDGDADDRRLRALSERVRDALGTGVESVAELDGGEVGRVARVALADGRTVAAKTGETPLTVEAFMLDVLADRGLPVPDVYHRDDDLLVLEYVDGDSEISPAVERDAAGLLAALHGERPADRDGPNGDATGESNGDATGRYGFPRDTVTGPYRQPNPWTDSWVAFFRDRRLDYFAGKAREEGLLSPSLAERLDALADDLDSLLPDDPPSALLHGDVWANNVLTRDGEVRALLDPACYFGHAEVELAYVDFGGSFGDAFFETYDDERGIDPGFRDERCAVYQLVPLLEHLLYFGEDRYAAGLRERLTDLGY